MGTDYSINPIMLKESIAIQLDSKTRIRIVDIEVLGKVFNVRVYFEEEDDNIKSGMVTMVEEGLPGKFKHYTEKHPLVLGDMKKGSMKRICLRIKEPNEKAKPKAMIFGGELIVKGEIG